MLTDTHCHLVSEKLRHDTKGLVERAQVAGVSRIINIAYNQETTEIGLKLAQEFSNVWTTAGIQPHDSASYSPQLAEMMKNLFKVNESLVAIGEIGLDAHYNLSPMPAQERCFEHFLEIAVAVDRPIVVHVRNTHKAVKERIASLVPNNLRGVIHCFTGTLNEAKEFLDLGFYISFSGIVTFKNATDLMDVSRYVPNDRILIETDSPYLAPIPMRGKINEPSFLKHTAQRIAEVRGLSLEAFAELTTRNALNLFGLRNKSIQD